MSSIGGGPVPGSYWVDQRRLLAGPYPDDAARLVAAGITATVDLTECEAAAGAALETVRQWSGSDHSPETDDQRGFVKAWRPAPPAVDESAPPPASS